LTIPVAGIPISVTRTYDTLTSNTKDDFGYGWRLEFRDTNLKTSLGKDETFETFDILSKGFKQGDKVYITLPGGKREAYKFLPELDRLGGFLLDINGNGGLWHPKFVSQSGSKNTLTVDDVLLTKSESGQFVALAGLLYNPVDPYFGGGYTLTTKEGIAYEIDASTGDLKGATDTNGNKLKFSESGITSSTGVNVKFGRDSQGRIVNVTDPQGNVIKYEYDAKGDLVGVTDREKNKTQFKYNTNRPHYLDSIIDPLGRTRIKNEYDSSGRLKRIIDTSGNPVEMVYDPNHSVETIKDALGHQTHYEYDDRGNLVRVVDALGGVTYREYDNNNNLLSETNPEGEKTSYTYDSRGNNLTITDPLGNTNYFTYNKFNKLLSITDALGNTVAYDYDSRRNQTAIRVGSNVIKQSFDAQGNIVAITAADGSTTQFFYDLAGNVIKQVDALGNETNYTYDANDNLLTEVKTVTLNGSKHILENRWSYDDEGRVTSTTDPAGNITHYEHDALGKTILAIDPLNRKTEYNYDNAGRLIETIYSDGSFTQTEYDALGREIAKKDRLGHVTRFTYDALGRLTEIIQPDDTPDDLSDNPRRKTEYNQVGRVTAEIDSLGNRTEYEYDRAGRLILTRDPLGHETKIAVNQESFKTSETDALNRVTRYFFNEYGWNVKTLFADGTSERYTYRRKSSEADTSRHLTLQKLIQIEFRSYF
ncbi:MAG: hypothetical protein ACRC11_21340, partial [Xenococcaceae cyanobacterium]